MISIVNLIEYEEHIHNAAKSIAKHLMAQHTEKPEPDDINNLIGASKKVLKHIDQQKQNNPSYTPPPSDEIHKMIRKEYEKPGNLGNLYKNLQKKKE
jgi:hypothetical protein